MTYISSLEESRLALADKPFAEATIRKPSAAAVPAVTNELAAKAQKTSASEGPRKLVKPAGPADISKGAEIIKEIKPAGLADISKGAEIIKEITVRLIDVAKIGVVRPHDPLTATIAAGGLMAGAFGIIGGEKPAEQTLKAVGTIGSMAANVTEGVLAGTAAFSGGGLLIASSVGMGAFTLTEIALKASASTKVGAWIGGGAGEQLAEVLFD